MEDRKRCRTGNVGNVGLHNKKYHWQAFYRLPSGISLLAQQVERPTNKPELLNIITNNCLFVVSIFGTFMTYICMQSGKSR